MDDASNQFVRADDVRTILNDFLSKVATKEDLKVFATKDDLKHFATKNDLKNFATKDDLKGFARQETIETLKSDIDTIKKDVENLASDFDGVKVDVDRIKTDVDEMKNKMDSFATKDDLKNFVTKSDFMSLKQDVGSLAKDVKTIKKDVDTLKSDNDKLNLKMRGVSEFQDKIMFQVVNIRHMIEDQLINIHTFEHFKNEIYNKLDAFGNYEQNNQLEHKTQNYRMKKMSKILKHERVRNDEQDVKISNNQTEIERVKTKVA